MQVWGLTDQGIVRQQNQDFYDIVCFDEDCLLAVVCDGMGGARAGNVASTMAVELFLEHFFQGSPSDSPEDILPQALSPSCLKSGRQYPHFLCRNPHCTQPVLYHSAKLLSYFCRLPSPNAP